MAQNAAVRKLRLLVACALPAPCLPQNAGLRGAAALPGVRQEPAWPLPAGLQAYFVCCRQQSTQGASSRPPELQMMRSHRRKAARGGRPAGRRLHGTGKGRKLLTVE